MQLVAAVTGPEGTGRLRPLDDEGAPAGPERAVPDLAVAVAELERAHQPRWLFTAAAETYPALVGAGVRVRRCHDVTLTEGILLNHAGRHREPRGLAAAWARTAGLPVPADRPPPRQHRQPALFEPEPDQLPGGADPLDALIAVHAAQRERLAGSGQPGPLRLLVAAESACGLAAAEMSHDGLPWRADVHDALLTELLGPRPPSGARPKRLTELAERVSAAFGREVNPDHSPSVVRAFKRLGIEVPSARAHVLRQVDHPVVAPLLEYKELSRLYAAHGWSWLDSWVHNGRFRPEYVIGGVVSGRWATNGGAALQIPKLLRTAAQSDPGWTFVVADAAQLEPRVLAALSGDRKLAEVAGDTDLYGRLAADSFDGDRGRAKIAMLSAMYGGTSGEAGPLLAVLRRRFPAAVGYVEDAARAGEQGRMVRSVLGRTSPTPGSGFDVAGDVEPSGAEERRTRQASREWGRFTRNFVVQASAADWAAALLAGLRTHLASNVPAAELVFFQHDEVLVHCPTSDAEAVTAAIDQSARQATTLVFDQTPVHFPLQSHTVTTYADGK